MNNKDKVVCITGAGNGIGRAIAVEMNKCGYNVACADIDIEAAQKTVLLLNSKIGKSISIKIDVRNLDNIDTMMQIIVNSFGRLDVMVNNAGVTRVSCLEDLSEDDWDWIHSINAKGTFFCLQAAAKQMIKQNFGGRIINMSSIGAKGFLDVSNAIYAASKGAVLSLTKTAAQELGKYEITVNSICPGVTLTDILDKIITTRSKEQNKSKETILMHYLRNSPLGKPNEPKHIASMVSFLSSEGAKNISGQSFSIDGGTIPS